MQPRTLLLLFMLLPLLASAQVQLAADLVPGSEGSDPSNYQVLNGKLYFSATTPATGQELYVYDPATRATRLVADLVEGAEGSEPANLVVLDGKLYFLASKVFFPFFIGRQLYRVLYEYDPESNQTRLVETFTFDGDRGVELTISPSDLLVLNSKLYILSRRVDEVYLITEGLKVTVYDPVAKSFSNGFSFGSYESAFEEAIMLTALDGKIYAWGGNDADYLVSYDPVSQTASTSNVSYNVREITPLDGKLFYRASAFLTSPEANAELYIFDPATQTEALVADLAPGSTSSSPQDLTVLEGKLYFQANQSGSGQELWVYDPATEAPRLVADIVPGDSSSAPRALFAFEDLLYFSAQTSALGRELYRYDSSTDSVTLVANLAADTVSGNPANFTAFQDELYFSATTPATGRELWKLGGQVELTLTLVDRRQNQAVATLGIGTVVDLAELDLTSYSIAAEASDSITRVAFELNGPVSLSVSDTEAPFVLFEEAQSPQAGAYTLIATPFSTQSGSEVAGDPVTVTFSLQADNLSVTDARLVQVPSGQRVQSLQEGDEVFLAELPQPLSLLVDASQESQSVLLELSGAQNSSVLQNEAPYALFGKQAGQIAPGTFLPGDYTLTVTPYSAPDRQGYAGEPLVINFTINTNPYRQTTLTSVRDILDDYQYIDPVAIEGTGIVANIQSGGNEYSGDSRLVSYTFANGTLTRNNQAIIDEDRVNFSAPTDFALSNRVVAATALRNALGSDGILYIYRLNEENSLDFVQSFTKPLTGYGIAVATDGKRIAVANSSKANFFEGVTGPIDEIFIYERLGNQWKEVDTIAVASEEVNDLAIEGNTLVLDNGQVYRFVDGEWSATQTIPTGGGGLALQNGTLVAGRNVYRLQEDTWVQTATLSTSDSVSLGGAVAIDGSRIAIRGGDAVYVFRRENSQWMQFATITPDQPDVTSFGGSVDISGLNLVVSAFTNDPDTAKAFVYTLIDTLAPAKPSIERLTLINTDNDEDQVIAASIEDGDVIDLFPGDVYEYTIVAQVASAGQRIRRVVLDLTAPAGLSRVRAEYAQPYALYGDVQGNVRGVKPYAGNYRLVATPYYLNSAGQEVAGPSKTVNFMLTTRGAAARNLRVVSTDGSLVETLEEGDVLTLSPEQEVTILADAANPQFNSLLFDLQGPVSAKRTENFIPFGIFGDTKGRLSGRVLSPGRYRLSVTPFLGKNQDGYGGPEVEVSFTVVEQADNSLAQAYPVPFENTLTVRMSSLDLRQTRVELVHGYGQVYEVPASQVSQTEAGLQLKLGANLPSGPYTLRVMTAGKVQTFRVSKE